MIIQHENKPYVTEHGIGRIVFSIKTKGRYKERKLDINVARETYCLQVLQTANLQHVQQKHPNLLDHQEHLLKYLQHQTLRCMKVMVKKFIKINLWLLQKLKPIVLALSSNAFPYSMWQLCNVIIVQQTNKTYKQQTESHQIQILAEQEQSDISI